MVSTLDSPPASPLPPRPSIPARSPLRPPARSISNELQQQQQQTTTTTAIETPIIAEGEMPISFQMRSASFPSLKALALEDPPKRRQVVRPVSPLVLSPMDDESGSSSSGTSSLMARSPATTAGAGGLTKRQHALHELLASERAYASDLALIREVHVPLALGQPVPLHIAAQTPPRSSSSSARTNSTASSNSSSPPQPLGPPMTPDDVKIIFSNITELAIFSDSFCDSLEEALGSVLEGGVGEDHVGELFLRIIPEMERPYKYYIARQRSADEHLQNLPKTPALEAYYTQTRTLATSLSHAWDLHSLLIKPVQRLLKYPLLLSAIIDETPDSHGDRAKLVEARERVEEVARNVNEERRRAEIVNKILTSPSSSASSFSPAAAAVKMKSSLRRSNTTEKGNQEAMKVERLHNELKRMEVFAQQFARSIVDWSKSTSLAILALRTWSLSFANVIGLSAQSSSEAFDAFMNVIADRLTPLVGQLERVVNERLLKDLATLLLTMSKPFKLLDSMNEQEPFHYHLLNMNIGGAGRKSDARPSPALLEASKNYLALRAQLASELPTYVDLLHHGLGIFVRKLADVQSNFYLDVRERWAELWEMLRVEGERNAGAEETLAVWYTRWGDVDEVLSQLKIVSPRPIYLERPKETQKRKGTRENNVRVTRSGSESKRKGEGAKTVGNVLASLDPTHHVSSPQPLKRGTNDTASVKSGKGSSKRGSDSSSMMKHLDGSKRSSNASTDDITVRTRPGANNKLRSPRPRTTSPEEFGEYVAVMSVPSPVDIAAPTSLPRTKSMPLPKSSPVSSSPTDERGRKPTFRRRISDTLRSSSKPRSPQPRMQQFELSPHTRGKYVCKVIHPCIPPRGTSYQDFPFFALREGDYYEVLEEAGHPSLHPDLPLYVDDGADYLLFCRDQEGGVGWALASFLEPLD